MKVVICPDKFKGSLSALEVASAIEKGLKRYDPTIETVLHPLADGGEGSLAIFDLDPLVHIQKVEVSDPLGRTIEADYRIKGEDAYIEMAKASGLVLLKQTELDVMQASSYGTGQLILDAIDRGCKNIYLFIGGSATNDGGMGIASALGYLFKDANGEEVAPIGENLIKVKRIEKANTKTDLNGISFYTICDVTNPFFGEMGAAYIYAAQKGANNRQIEFLDDGLRNFAEAMKREIGIDIANIAGSGAAGGIGGGSVAFLNAKLRSGIQTIMQMTGFEEKCRNANWIISGEGKADHQSLHGKVISGVSEIANKWQIPYFLIVGRNELEEMHRAQLNIREVLSVMSKANSVEYAMTNAAEIVEHLSYELGKSYLLQ